MRATSLAWDGSILLFMAWNHMYICTHMYTYTCIYIYIYIYIHTYMMYTYAISYERDGSILLSEAEAPPLKIHQRGMQWRQGVVVHIRS